MRPEFKTIGIVLLLAACAGRLFAGDEIAGENELRSERFASGTVEETRLWQKEQRPKLAGVLAIDDLFSREAPAPFEPETISTEKREKYVYHEMEIDSTPGRRISIVLTVPADLDGPFPAVVAIGGHGSVLQTCHQSERTYKRFAHVLAEKGYVTIAVCMSGHKIHEKGRNLVGERLWDLMRCVDFLAAHEQIDAGRIGCAGLSLGGEMAMWLGAMDERVQATVSSGFLTSMDQMEKDHCMCWKVPGLRELVDFPDIYSLTAPRALLCQNGLKEPPSQFPVSLAREMLKEIEPVYRVFGCPENLEFVAHEGGHEIHLPSLVSFFDKHLGGTEGDG